MNYDLTGGTPPKETGSPIEDNYIRQDTGIYGKYDTAGNPAEDQSAAFFNGNSDKPYPEDRNFVIDANAEERAIGVGANYTPSTTAPDIRLGQIKYVKRAGVESVYKDETRNTANDDLASAKAEGSQSMDYLAEMYNEDNEENQNGNS